MQESRKQVMFDGQESDKSLAGIFSPLTTRFKPLMFSSFPSPHSDHDNNCESVQEGLCFCCKEISKK